jgi:hypothetical protein
MCAKALLLCTICVLLSYITILKWRTFFKLLPLLSNLGLTALLNFNQLGVPCSPKPKDAFDRLAFSQKPPAPILEEVQKA